MSDLAQALMVAIKVHAGQVDKQGEPYLLHVLRVVEAVSAEAKVVAALHDVLEDGPSADIGSAIRLLTGRELRALELLSRLEGQSYADYIAAIAREDDIALEVKLADLRDNLGRIPPEPTDNCGPCEGHGELNPGWGAGCGYCKNTGYGPDRQRWRATWLSLAGRYEKAIATLEASS